jgi:hypothetical protein
MTTHIVKILWKVQRYLPAIAVAIGLGAFASANSASANVENILWNLAIDQPIEQFFPNEVHPDFPKQLTFEGTIHNPTATDGILTMFFDWVDINDPSTAFTSTPVNIPVGDGGTIAVNMTETIDFCPPMVSLHARIANAPTMTLEGTFTHECMIPEPSSALTAGLGLLGLVAAYRRRR